MYILLSVLGIKVSIQHLHLGVVMIIVGRALSKTLFFHVLVGSSSILEVTSYFMCISSFISE